MQTEKRLRKSPACHHENGSLGKHIHFVCFSSESGISAAFEQIWTNQIKSQVIY